MTVSTATAKMFHTCKSKRLGANRASKPHSDADRTSTQSKARPHARFPLSSPTLSQNQVEWPKE
jgi:hypothetical protein